MKSKTLKALLVIMILLFAIPSVFAQSYKTYTDSSVLNNQTIYRNEKVWIVGVSSSFSMNRAIEKAIQNAFSSKGIKTIISTDKIDISGMEDSIFEKLTDYMNEEEFRYLLFCWVDDIYTYTYGDGIARMEFSGTMYDMLSGSEIMIIQMSTEADKNDRLSFNATRDPALKSMAEELASEYLRTAK